MKYQSIRDVMDRFLKIPFLRKLLVRGVFMSLLVFNVLVPTRFVHADVWGAAISATLLDQVLTTIKTQIEGAILGTLKVAAMTMLQSKVGQLIGGSSAGSAMIITDWNEFLYQTPAEKTRLFMNDFFSTVTRGKAASTNYVGLGDGFGNVQGNYTTYLVAAAGGADSATAFPVYNLDSYVSSPEDIFQKGNWRGWNAYFDPNAVNSPFAMQIVAQSVRSQKLAQEQEQVKVESMASGFRAPKIDGKTIAPVATIEGMARDTQNIANNVIAAAKNPAEFLSGVVGALATKVITNLVQRGVGAVQANIKREIGNLDKKLTTALNKADKQLGPAAKFTSSVSQRTDVYIKPYTQPPPAAGTYCDGGC